MSKGLPFDLITLVFGNLDAFVEVARVKVACKEERKLISTRKESKESKEVEVLPVTEDAERLALSGPPHHCPPRPPTESALYLHTPNFRQGLRIHRTFFLLLMSLRMFTVRHLGGHHMLIPTHDLPSLHFPT